MITHPETSINVFVVHPDSTYGPATLPVVDGTVFRGLQETVGGYIQPVTFDTSDGELDLWLDEDGLAKRHSVNLLAMWITARLRGSRHSFSEPLLGTGVFAATDHEGNTRSLTPAMLHELERLVDLFNNGTIPVVRHPEVSI